jgi:RNA polymerase sigma-70 factor (ECF subfamily)
MTARDEVTMSEHDHDRLAHEFEAHRAHLRTVAHRMLGSANDADDAVQESWLRLSRANPTGVDNLRGWLTTVVARVCLDQLRARKSRPEEPFGDDVDHPAVSPDVGDAEIADAMGVALLVVLESLAPAERVAFVLHDMFDVPFGDIASIVGRTPEAARQLASRARRRVRGATTTGDANANRHREIVDAFLAASRNGDFAALLELLDPAVVLRADAAAVLLGATSEVSGATGVATTFSGRAQGARPALVNGAPGALWAPGGQPRVAFAFTIADDRIVAIDLLADPEQLRRASIAP